MEPLRALIVEDSEDDAELLLRELRRGGYDVTSLRVQTAEDMEAALNRQQWDIVYSDWSMPAFGALEALDVLKHNDTHGLPFIIVSGTVGEDVAVAALRSGAHDFFLKDKLVRLVSATERELRDADVRRQRSRMQEQLVISDRMASVGLLASGVAHEINNPLTSVIGNLDLALQALAELHEEAGDASRLGDVVDELRDAYDAAERIRTIAAELRLFARADDEEHTAVDVQRVIESSLQLASTEIRHRARVSTSFSAVPPVEANESKLGQVFLNLLVNAAQAIPEGRADTNEIAVATMLSRDGQVVVEVRDTGTGITPEVRKRLFTPFFTTKPHNLGTGLGLSICHRIVSGFGGSITLDSEPGKGSAFRVHLLPARMAPTAPAAPTGTAQQPTRRGSVLVVDDERQVALLVQRALAQDHDITTTSGAEEALEKIAAGGRYDLILCDLMMPEVTGMELHARLTRVAPDQADKMIFLTGGAFTTGAREFLKQVQNLVVEKPFTPMALRAVVNDRIR